MAVLRFCVRVLVDTFTHSRAASAVCPALCKHVPLHSPSAFMSLHEQDGVQKVSCAFVTERFFFILLRNGERVVEAEAKDSAFLVSLLQNKHEKQKVRNQIMTILLLNPGAAP